MRAVILAGGRGTRLRPYTTLLPKPLVPIGDDKAVVEIIIEQLVRAGVTHITVAVNHLANLIMNFIGNGDRWGIKIDYSLEDKPLSTIGPLKLIKDLPEHFLVLNGDILTDLNFRDLYETHKRSESQVTVATFRRSQKTDYGVIDTNDKGRIIGFREKPVQSYLVSMGVYALTRSVLTSVQTGVAYGFDNLMYDCIANNQPASTYLWEGFWLDIGRPEDYDYCNENHEQVFRTLQI
jgi:NDP-sugar pyrophosphorylase family protein